MSTTHRLLHQHMVPGVWVGATTDEAKWSVLAGGELLRSDTQPSLTAIHRLSSTSLLSVSSSSSLSNTQSPTAHLRVGSVPSSLLEAEASIDTSGKGLVGMAWNATPLLQGAERMVTALSSLTERRQPTDTDEKVEYYRNDPSATTSSTVTDDSTNNNNNNNKKDESGTNTASSFAVKFASRLEFDLSPSTDRTVPLFDSIPESCQTWHGLGSYKTNGASVAIETSVPLSTLEPQTKYHVSCDLNSSSSSGPPLVVDLYKSPTSSSMSLSQLLTFDRMNLNVVEQRCPNIRNTLGWTVQMTKPMSMEQDVDKTKPSFRAGVAWQLNRNIAVKAVLSPSGTITGALLMKQWREPSVTCSILYGSGGLQGFGLELETGPPIRVQNNNRSTHGNKLYPSGASQKRSVDGSSWLGVPETKATLPEED